MGQKELVEDILRKGVEAAAKLGKTLEFEKFLEPGKARYNSREVVNAVGKALDELGIPNNLWKEPT